MMQVSQHNLPRSSDLPWREKHYRRATGRNHPWHRFLQSQPRLTLQMVCLEYCCYKEGGLLFILQLKVVKTWSRAGSCLTRPKRMRWDLLLKQEAASPALLVIDPDSIAVSAIHPLSPFKHKPHLEVIWVFISYHCKSLPMASGDSDKSTILPVLTHIVQGSLPDSVSLVSSHKGSIDSDREVTIDYGDKSNEELLHLYGKNLGSFQRDQIPKADWQLLR